MEPKRDSANRREEDRIDWKQIEIKQKSDRDVYYPQIYSHYLEGVRDGGRNTNNIRYADDTVLVADSETKLRLLVPALHRACAAKGLGTNFGQGKTEIMGNTKRAQDLTKNIRMERSHITQVEKYKYLGLLILKYGKCETWVLKSTAIEKSYSQI